MQTCVLILKAKTSFLVTHPVLQLPAPGADCAAVYRSLGTAQSTATCRPANGEKNNFPKWDGPGAAFLSHNSKVKCLSLTFDLFEIQSIKCSCCTGHVFKLDKCKSSHLPIYITRKKQFLSDSRGNSTACSFQKFKFLPGLRGILASRTVPNLAQTCVRSSSEHCREGNIVLACKQYSDYDTDVFLTILFQYLPENWDFLWLVSLWECFFWCPWVFAQFPLALSPLELQVMDERHCKISIIYTDYELSKNWFYTHLFSFCHVFSSWPETAKASVRRIPLFLSRLALHLPSLNKWHNRTHDIFVWLIDKMVK